MSLLSSSLRPAWRTIILLPLSFLSPATAPATTFVWNRNTTINSNWDTAANWNPSGPPISGAHGIAINSLCSAGSPVIFNGGTTTLSTASTFGEGPLDSGHLHINSGTLDLSAGTTTIGNSGTGAVTINSGGTLKKQAGLLGLGVNAGGSGTITVNPGGVLSLMKGSVSYAIGGAGNGTLQLYGGSLQLSNTAVKAIDVGTSSGSGVIDIRGGSISALGSTKTQSLRLGYVGGDGTGRATLTGYGEVNMLNGAAPPTGAVQIGGFIIGDGTEPDLAVSDHTLNLATYSSLVTAHNKYGSALFGSYGKPDPIYGTTCFGFYTCDRGAIRLKPQTLAAGVADLFWGDDHISGTYWTIGHSNAKKPLVLVNSAYLHRSDISQPVTVIGTLLDPARTKTSLEAGNLLSNNTGKAFMNIWQITAVGGPLALDKFCVRYDASTEINGAGNLGPLLGFYYWNGTTGTWQDLTGSTTIDKVNSLVNYNGAISIGNGASGYFALAAAPAPAPGVTRLFILSGQSNMNNLQPEASFTPAIRQAFPNDDIIVVKVAQSGRPIYEWYKDWLPESGLLPEGVQTAGIYKTLMSEVSAAMQGKRPPATVAFVWMQGEADTHSAEYANVYESSLRGLIAQLRRDLKRPDTFAIIGRISDYVYIDYPQGPLTVRAAQVSVSETDSRAAWINTDDLNGSNNGLHYTASGYQILGERFAAKVIELLQQ